MMAGVHASELPKHVRDRLGLGSGVGRGKPSRAGIGLSAPCPGHCGCGQPFPTAAAWERHAAAAGHRRWAIDLGDQP